MQLIEIHDIETGRITTARFPHEFKDATDRSAAELTFESGEVIAMGKIIARTIEK